MPRIQRFAVLCFAILTVMGCTGEGLPLSGGPDREKEPEEKQPPVAGSFVYVATAGMSRPRFTPVEETGRQASRQLGPNRGADYGVQQGSMYFKGVTPDESKVVVQFDALDRSGAVFALSTSGENRDNPIRVAPLARPYTTPVDLVFSHDSTRVAYVDEDGVFVARLDGSGERLVAPHAWEGRLEDLTFSLEDDYIVFLIEGRGIFSARADGSDDELRTVTQAIGRYVGFAGVAPGGRVLMPDGDVLYSYPVTGSGARIRLTPVDLDSGMVAGFVGDHIVLSFTTRVGGGYYDDRLASTPLDGSGADTPFFISAATMDARHATVRGDRVIFVGKMNEQSAIFDVPALTTPTERDRITPWMPGNLYFSGPTDRWVYFCDYQGEVYRVERAGVTAQPELIASFETSNQCGFGGLTGNDRFAVVWDHPSGTHYLVSVEGGSLEPLGFSPRAVLRSGIAELDFGREIGAAFLKSPGREPLQLTPWHDARIEEAHLASGSQLVYRTLEPDQRWYAARLDGSDSETENAISIPEVGQRYLGATDGYAVIRGDSEGLAHIAAYSLDGSTPEGTTMLSRQAVSLTRFHPPSGRVVAALPHNAMDNVVSARISGANSNAPAVIAEGLRWVTALAVDPDSSTVFVSGADRVLKTSVDGSSPSELLAETDGSMGLTLVPDKGRLLIALVTGDTAVPHPREVLTVPVDGSEPVRSLGGPQMFPVGVHHDGDFDPIEVPYGEDGWIVLGGRDGLYGTTVEALGEPTQLLAVEQGQWARIVGGYAPNRKALVVGLEDRLMLVEKDGSRELATFEGGLNGGTWSADGTHFVFAVASEGVRVFAVSAVEPDFGSIQELASLPYRGGEIVGATPDGAAAILSTKSGGDFSLYMATLADGQLVPMTPIDDAEERLIGFVDLVD